MTALPAIESVLTRRVRMLLNDIDEQCGADAGGAAVAQCELLLGGIAALMLFVQFNWTGMRWHQQTLCCWY